MPWSRQFTAHLVQFACWIPGRVCGSFTRQSLWHQNMGCFPLPTSGTVAELLTDFQNLLDFFSVVKTYRNLRLVPLFLHVLQESRKAFYALEQNNIFITVWNISIYCMWIMRIHNLTIGFQVKSFVCLLYWPMCWGDAFWD